MMPLSYHLLNLLLIALETMRLLVLIVTKSGMDHTRILASQLARHHDR